MSSSSWARIDQVGVGRRAVDRTVCAPPPAGAAPQRSRDGLDDRGRLGIVAEAEAGQHPLQCGGAQRVGGAVAGAPRPVQPAAALDGLRCPHHHGHLFGDQRADASPFHSASSATTRHSCTTIHVTRSGMRSESVAAPLGSRPRCCCGAYQITRGCVPARFIASAALPSVSRPELVMKSRGADDRDGSPVVGVADQRAVVAARHVRRRLPPRRCRLRPNWTVAGARRLPQVAVGVGTAEGGRRRRVGSRGASASRVRDAGSTSSRSPGRAASRRSTSSSTR